MDERLKYRLVGGLVLLLLALLLSFLLPAPEPEGRRATSAVVIDLRASPAEIAQQVQASVVPSPTAAPQLPEEAFVVPVTATPLPAPVPTARAGGVSTPAPRPTQPPRATPVPRVTPSPVAPTPVVRPSPTATRAPAVASEAWWVQVGAYGAREGAEQVRETLRVVDLPAVVQSASVDGRTVHRVRIGPFDTRLAAESAQARAVLLGHANAAVFRQP